MDCIVKALFLLTTSIQLGITKLPLYYGIYWKLEMKKKDLCKPGSMHIVLCTDNPCSMTICFATAQSYGGAKKAIYTHTYDSQCPCSHIITIQAFSNCHAFVRVAASYSHMITIWDLPSWLWIRKSVEEASRKMQVVYGIFLKDDNWDYWNCCC